MVFQVNKDYPKPAVEEKNEEYGKILLQDYAGIKSEETAIHLYMFQSINSAKTHPEFASAIEKIAISEMKHLDLLGTTIKLLGVEPIFATYCTDSSGDTLPWSSSFVSYKTDLLEMLETNIKSETSAIENYEIHRELIDDIYVKDLLTRIIDDEYTHLNYFIDYYNLLMEKNSSK